MVDRWENEFQTLSKALYVLSATAWAAPDLLKALANLSDTTVRRSAVNRKDLKLHWKSDKRPHFRNDQHTYFKEFNIHKWETNKTVVFSHRPLPNILKYRDHRWDLPAVWATRFLQMHMVFHSASIDESSGSNFFRNTTGKNQDQTPLTHQGWFWLLNQFGSYVNWLVLEGQAGKGKTESPRFEFSEKFFANSSALTEIEENTSGLLNWTRIADLSLWRTLLTIRQKSQKPSFWEVSNLLTLINQKRLSFVLLEQASLTASITLLERLLACLRFTLDAEDLFYWYKWKEWFLWAMAAGQTTYNQRV